MADWFDENSPPQATQPQQDWFAQNAPTAVVEPPKQGGVVSGILSGLGQALNPINLVKGALDIGHESDISQIYKYGKTLGEIVTGKSPDEAIGKNIPELQQQREAVYGKLGTKEQAKALTGIGLQLGMTALPFLHGETLPRAPGSLAETAGIAKPDIAQPSEPVATDQAAVETQPTGVDLREASAGLNQAHVPSDAMNAANLAAPSVPAAVEPTTASSIQETPLSKVEPVAAQDVLGKQESVAPNLPTGTGEVVPETIAAAAVRHGDGRIETGPTHALITGGHAMTGEDGFVTNTGRFVDAKEAHDIAVKANQAAPNRSGIILAEEVSGIQDQPVSEAPVSTTATPLTQTERSISGNKTPVAQTEAVGTGEEFPTKTAADLGEMYHGSLKGVKGAPKTGKDSGTIKTKFGDIPVVGTVFDGFFLTKDAKYAELYSAGKQGKVESFSLHPDAKVLSLPNISSEEVLSSRGWGRAKGLTSLKQPTEPFPFQKDFENYAFDRLNQERVKNGKASFTNDQFQKQVGDEWNPTKDDYDLNGLAAKYLPDYIKSKGFDAVEFGREVIALNPEKVVRYQKPLTESVPQPASASQAIASELAPESVASPTQSRPSETVARQPTSVPGAEAETAAAPLPKETEPTQSSPPPTEPPTVTEAAPISDDQHVSTIANKFTEERTKSGELGEIAPGQGYSTKEMAAQGLKMSPEEINQNISDLMNDTGNPIEQGKAVRAEEARLSQRSNELSRAAADDPTNVEAKLAADNAFKDVTDFHNGPVAKLKTIFHATGVGLQGELPVDLSTFNGLREQFLRDTGKAPPPEAEPQLREMAEKVSNSVKEDNGAKQNLSQAIEKATSKRKLPTYDEVRQSIADRMKTNPCRV